MRRPFLTFLLLLVLPAIVVAAAAMVNAANAWADLHETSHRRVAGMVLAALDEELVRSAAVAAETAVPVEDPDPADPSVRRALSGDTVTGYRAEEGNLEVVVVLGGADGGPVRMGSAPVDGRFAGGVGRAAGYRTAIYVRRARWAGTVPPVGADTLGPGVLEALGTPPHSLPDGGGLLWAGEDPGVSPPALVALAVPRDPPGSAVARPVLLVMGLLFLFSALAGWIQLSRPTAGPVGAPTRASVVLLAVLPSLATAGLLSHLDRSHRDKAADLTARDLTRGLAVAASRGLADSPRAVQQLTGFHTTRVQGGGISSSTFGVEGTAALATLRRPPPSFTSAGRIDTPEGPSVYVALRLREGGFVVATSPFPTEEMETFGMRQRGFAGALAVWLAFVATLFLLRGRGTVS